MYMYMYTCAVLLLKLRLIKCNFEIFKMVKTACLNSSTAQGSILAFFQTHQPGKYVRKDTCPDKILLARSKLRNN